MRVLKRKKTNTSVSWAFHSDASGHVSRAGVQNQWAHVIILLFCAFAQRKCITDFYERPRPFMFNNLVDRSEIIFERAADNQNMNSQFKKKSRKRWEFFTEIRVRPFRVRGVWSWSRYVLYECANHTTWAFCFVVCMRNTTCYNSTHEMRYFFDVRLER